MKTIAILTDYSEASTHAARFALHLAKKIKANVVCYNLFIVEPKKKVQQELAWQADEILDDPKADCERNLMLFCAVIENELTTNSFPGATLPAITYQYCKADVADVMAAIIDNRSISLIVTTTQGNDDLATFMARDNYQKIIDWATVPVLIVPENAAIRNPEKIAFAANLDPNDTDHINKLTSLMEHFSPEVMVTHINTNPQYNEYETAENLLVTNIRNKVDYGRIYYRSTSANNKQKGWEWLSKNKSCDMLAIVQQPAFVMDELFKLGSTPQITYNLLIPLLIFPALI